MNKLTKDEISAVRDRLRDTFGLEYAELDKLQRTLLQIEAARMTFDTWEHSISETLRQYRANIGAGNLARYCDVLISGAAISWANEQVEVPTYPTQQITS